MNSQNTLIALSALCFYKAWVFSLKHSFSIIGWHKEIKLFIFYQASRWSHYKRKQRIQYSGVHKPRVTAIDNAWTRVIKIQSSTNTFCDSIQDIPVNIQTKRIRSCPYHSLTKQKLLLLLSIFYSIHLCSILNPILHSIRDPFLGHFSNTEGTKWGLKCSK